jgi:hypothetical protein
VHARDAPSCPLVVAMMNPSCPRRGLSLPPTGTLLAIEHCPRCIACSRIRVRLFASTLPTDEPYVTASATKPCASAAAESPGPTGVSLRSIGCR